MQSALWDATAALKANELGKRQDVSSARVRELLGNAPRSPEEMILAMTDSLIAQGVVVRPRR